MADKKAIRPDFFLNVPALQAVKDAKGTTDEERALYAMANTAGWKVFERLAKDAIKQINQMNRLAISQGLPVEEIGRNAIVANLAQEAVERLINRVTDAVDAIDGDSATTEEVDE